MDTIERAYWMFKLLLFVAGIVPATATIIHNAEQAWNAATSTEDRVKIVVAALEDLLSHLRAAI